MPTLFFIVYIVLALTGFSVNRILNKRYVFVSFFIISTLYLLFSIYGIYYKIEFAEFFSWMFFYVLTYKFFRNMYLKERRVEPIVSRGRGFDFSNNRVGDFSDYLFTMLMLIVPSLCSFVFYEIITKVIL